MLLLLAALLSAAPPEPTRTPNVLIHDLIPVPTPVPVPTKRVRSLQDVARDRKETGSTSSGGVSLSGTAAGGGFQASELAGPSTASTPRTLADVARERRLSKEKAAGTSSTSGMSVQSGPSETPGPAGTPKPVLKRK